MSAATLIKAAAVNVGTTPTLLTAGMSTTNTYPQQTIVKNNGAAIVYIGGKDVTTAQGYPLAANEVLNVDEFAGGLYGIVATGTVECRVLEGA